jgi:ubiquitin C-terminal hydrolase
VTCCECGNNSISFDNYREICLPVPKDTSSCNIDTCLKLFTAGEILDGKDAFFCPECNINSTSSKTMSIWRFPPVLILHFKRFFFTQTHSYKISTKISFPLHNLDLSPYNGDSSTTIFILSKRLN